MSIPKLISLAAGLLVAAGFATACGVVAILSSTADQDWFEYDDDYWFD
jgi:hypothetical protein